MNPTRVAFIVQADRQGRTTLTTTPRNRLQIAKAVGDAATHATDTRHRESVEMTAKVARQAIKDMSKALQIT